MELSNLGLDAATLGGTLDEKLRAVREAGFSRIALWGKDLIGGSEGPRVAAGKVRESGLHVSAFQLVRDFEGLPGHLFEYKLEIAKSMMKLMQLVGSKLLVVCSSMSPHAAGDIEKIARDLSLLGTLATPFGIRIGYEALAWGRWVNQYPAAWEAIKRADRKNVGLVIDSFHIFAMETPLTHFDDIPAEKIFLVQLSDSVWDYTLDVEDLIETSRRRRVFPGEGVNNVALAELVRRIDRAGYRGDYLFEVFNDEHFQCAPSAVAERARRSAQWLSDQVSGDRCS